MTQAKTYNTAEMEDAEFWQTIALESVVNEDPSRAFALRVEEFFDDATCRPRQRDRCKVIGLSLRAVDEFLMKDEFDAETVKETEGGDVMVSGLEYTDPIVEKVIDDGE